MPNSRVATNGVGVMLLKSKTKRRRTNAEILAEKEQQLREKQEQVEQARRIEQLEQQLNRTEALIV